MLIELDNTRDYQSVFDYLTGALVQDPMMDFLPCWYHLYSTPNYAKNQCYESIVLSQGLLHSQESLEKYAERIPEQGA
jgi:hypothetical protein